MDREKQAPVLIKPRRRRLWNILMALVIFAAGVGVGSGVSLKLAANAFKKSLREPAVLADQITQRMKRRLDLSEEQTVQVRRILRENISEIRALRAKLRPELMAQLRKTRNELETVLTPEQGAKMTGRFQNFLKFWLPQDPPGEPSGSE